MAAFLNNGGYPARRSQPPPAGVPWNLHWAERWNGTLGVPLEPYLIQLHCARPTQRPTMRDPLLVRQQTGWASDPLALVGPMAAIRPHRRRMFLTGARSGCAGAVRGKF